MHKEVNGKIAEVPNIALFEKAFESIALGKKVISNVNELDCDIDWGIVNECTNAYKRVYKSLPFPLYSIEGSNIKYAVLAAYLKKVINNELEMWLDECLYIKIGKGTALKFIGNTWGIEKVINEKVDNTDIDLYKDEVGYEEFKWALTKLLQGESLRDYYNTFMKEFVSVCNGDPFILKNELVRILEFSKVPTRRHLQENKLLDINTGAEYFLDIFTNGKRKLQDIDDIIITLNNKDGKFKIDSRYIVTYDFDVYEKKESVFDGENIRIEKVNRIELDGAAALFQTLVGKANLVGGIENVKYSGLIINDDIIYFIDNEMYRCNTKTYSKAMCIAEGVEFYSYEANSVYVMSRNFYKNGVCKEYIYDYNIVEDSIKLCKIQFTSS